MMIRKDGRFFHIDFGHFLGHFKKMLLFDREDRTFYYSEALEEVLTTQGRMPDFLKFCEHALMVLRCNADTLMYLLLSMIGTGIPELQSIEDVRYIANVLMLDLSDGEAFQKFQKMLTDAKKSMRKGMSDVIHAIAHSRNT
jgi:phosphatidylinositol kinase/protein kinase (PI-3  family)